MILTCGSKKSRNFISGQNHINGTQSKHLTESEHSSVALIRRIGYSQIKWPILSIVSSMIDGQLCNQGDLMEAWKESVNNLQVNQKSKS
jgi:glycerol-3-phosphate dehydrogenase